MIANGTLLTGIVRMTSGQLEQPNAWDLNDMFRETDQEIQQASTA